VQVAIGSRGATLARPDGYVAWRAKDDAGASAEKLRMVLADVTS
jgi:hypothetical protein